MLLPAKTQRRAPSPGLPLALTPHVWTLLPSTLWPCRYTSFSPPAQFTATATCGLPTHRVHSCPRDFACAVPAHSPMSRSVSSFTSSLTCHLLRSLPKKPPRYSISLSCFIPSALSSLLICLLIYLFVCLTTRHKPHEGMNVFLVTAVSSDRAWQILGAN